MAKSWPKISSLQLSGRQVNLFQINSITAFYEANPQASGPSLLVQGIDTMNKKLISYDWWSIESSLCLCKESHGHRLLKDITKSPQWPC